MSPLGMLAVAIMVVGGVMVVVFSLIYYVKAFKMGVLMGILNLLIGMVYIMNQPRQAWRPFVLAWLGIFIFLGGGIWAEIQGVF